MKRLWTIFYFGLPYPGTNRDALEYPERSTVGYIILWPVRSVMDLTGRSIMDARPWKRLGATNLKRATCPSEPSQSRRSRLRSRDSYHALEQRGRQTMSPGPDPLGGYVRTVCTWHRRFDKRQRKKVGSSLSGRLLRIVASGRLTIQSAMASLPTLSPRQNTSLAASFSANSVARNAETRGACTACCCRYVCR